MEDDEKDEEHLAFQKHINFNGRMCWCEPLDTLAMRVNKSVVDIYTQYMIVTTFRLICITK